MELFEAILAARGISDDKRDMFLMPSYEAKHDPFLLPDMDLAVERLALALKEQQKVTIYGDYDIDGLTATALLLDALESFGYKNVKAYIPNRFIEGYGLTSDAVDRIAKDGADLIITVDCGSLSHNEIIHAKELGVDVIVTDHHNVAKVQPPAIAIINPKRLLQDYPNEYENYILRSNSTHQGLLYPFLDLAGVGVAFKLVQAMQKKLKGYEEGQEKWLLDLVALGTVCDVVNLTNENRANVHWGLKVLAKTRRPGLKALMAVSNVTPDKISSRALGFGLGPRMNAAGRLETAQYTLDLLRTKNSAEALVLAQKLDVLNTTRKKDQEVIYKDALMQAEQFAADNVLVVSGKEWNHGIIGIVAAKLMERYHKPTFVLEEMGDTAKGSARSFGDFSVADAIRAADDIITKGGGHKFAAGVTLPTKKVPAFRKRVNEYYRTIKLFNQHEYLLPKEDAVASLLQLNETLIEDLSLLEPFGNGNPEPVLSSQNLRVIYTKKMGKEEQHLKLGLQDLDGHKLYVISFNAPDHFHVDKGERVTIWYKPTMNEWQGRKSIEGYLLRIERA